MKKFRDKLTEKIAEGAGCGVIIAVFLAAIMCFVVVLAAAIANYTVLFYAAKYVEAPLIKWFAISYLIYSGIRILGSIIFRKDDD